MGEEPKSISRRDSLKIGLASLLALAAGKLVLRADAAPTKESGALGDYEKYMEGSSSNLKLAQNKVSSKGDLIVTQDNILGPFHRPGAPFRAKITPPLEPGKVVVVSGRIWGFDTKQPLADTTIEIWQANSLGRYDNDDPAKPPQKGVYLNRARLVSDENGYYEYETIHPGRYQVAPDTWRPSHIHYMVLHPGYKTLVTQLYFEGDPYNKTDQFVKSSLIRSFKPVAVGKSFYERAVFDIVLARN